MGATLEKQLEDVRSKKSDILKKIDERNKRKTIDCSSCDESHPINTLTLIQTYWYVPPHGCNEGDYWNEGEMQFVCPKTKVINRMLFDNSDVPWEKRREYENDPEAQFKKNYRPLFKRVIEVYEHSDNMSGTRYSIGSRKLKNEDVTNGHWVNNSYVDENRKEFGLVEKRKQED